MKKSLVVATSLSMLLLSTATFATEIRPKNVAVDRVEMMQTGRYTKIKNIPPVDQLNPLKVVVKTRIPQSVRTVRETVNFLLLRSGYSLADDVVLSHEARTLLNHKLPQIHRSIGPMTLDRALHTLSGEAFEVLVDPVNRKIGYELSSKLVRDK